MPPQGVVVSEQAWARVQAAVRWIERQAGGLELPGGPGAAPNILETFLARVTDGAPDADGHYTAQLTDLVDAEADAWEDRYEVLIRGANGEALANGKRYSARPAVPTAAGDDLYVAYAGAGGISGSDYYTPSLAGVTSTTTQTSGGKKMFQNTAAAANGTTTATLTAEPTQGYQGNYLGVKEVDSAISPLGDESTDATYNRESRLYHHELWLLRGSDGLGGTRFNSVAYDHTLAITPSYGCDVEILAIAGGSHAAHTDTLSFILHASITTTGLPTYGIRLGSTDYTGQYGTMPDGSVVKGGIITSIGGGGGGTGTVTSVAATAPAAGLTISGSPITTSGTFTFALADDLAALEALTGTNTIYYRSAASTWTAVTIGTGLTFSAGTLSASGGGSGAPATADYLVKTADAGLSAERVVTDTNTVTVDWSTAGQAKFNAAVHWSISSDSSGLILTNDVASPGNHKVYATDASGVRGYRTGIFPDVSNTYTVAQTILFANSSGVQIQDTDASHTMTLVLGSNLTANRTLTITPGDASRTVTLSGNLTVSSAATVSGTNTGDQTVPAAATQAEMEAASSTAAYSSPGRAQYHPGVAKAVVSFNGTGTVAITASYNVTSITDNGVGNYTVNFTTAFSSTNYTVAGMGNIPNGAGIICVDNTTPRATGSCKIRSIDNFTSSFTDISDINCVFFGDQ